MNLVSKVAQAEENKDLLIKKELGCFYESIEPELMAGYERIEVNEKFIRLMANKQEEESASDSAYQHCLEIHQSTLAKNPGALEILLHSGLQLCTGTKYRLSNCILHVTLLDDMESIWLFLRSGETVDAAIFAGGNPCNAFLLLKQEGLDDKILQLSEFCLLSLAGTDKWDGEFGLLTTYSYLTGKVYSSTIGGTSLDPLKNLLLADWLVSLRNQNQTVKENTTTHE